MTIHLNIHLDFRKVKDFHHQQSCSTQGHNKLSFLCKCLENQIACLHKTFISPENINMFIQITTIMFINEGLE